MRGGAGAVVSWLSRTETMVEFRLATARSGRSSPVKSPTATERGEEPTATAGAGDAPGAEPMDTAAGDGDPQGPEAEGGGEEVGPARSRSALVLDPGLVARVEALCDLVEGAEGWVAELDADACFWEVWRSAPAFSELILRAEVDPTDADVQRQLDALTAFSRALSLFVDGRPGASMRTYLDVVERADFASDPWLPPAMTRTDAVVGPLFRFSPLNVPVARDNV